LGSYFTETYCRSWIDQKVTEKVNLSKLESLSVTFDIFLLN
jgi:hypothetical protein